jgi:hypothetical protein
MDGSSDGDLSARLNDARNDPRSLQFDRGFAAETDRLFQARYGGAPPSAERYGDRSSAAPSGVHQAPTASSVAELLARNNDARNDPRSPKFDRAFAEETQRLYQQHYSSSGSSATPPDPSSSSPPAQSRESIGDYVPAAAKDYMFVGTEKTKPYVSDFAKDPVAGKAFEIFHKAGITQKQMSAVVGPLLEHFIDAGLVEKPVDYRAELLKLTPIASVHLGEPERLAAARQRVESAINQVKADARLGGLEAHVVEFVIEQLGDHAAGVKFLEFVGSRGRRAG